MAKLAVKRTNGTLAYVDPSGGVSAISDAGAVTVAFPPATQKFAIKPSDTARDSGGTGTTYTADPDLTIALTAGTWRIEAFVMFRCDSVTPGAKMRFAYSGTKSGNSGGYLANWEGGSYPHIGFLSPDFSNGDPIFTGLANTVQEFGFIASFVLVVTTSGNLVVEWAQNTSSTDDTIARAKSWLAAEQKQ